MDTIGEKEKFYGYIIGLQVERCPDDRINRKLYATFEYNGEVEVWKVPDSELFKILSSHLVSMANIRSGEDEYGYSKLWIEKKKGKWVVDLP